MPRFWNAIYLGHSTAQIDPTEQNDVAENAAALLGSYGSAGDPLSGKILLGEAIDFFGDNVLCRENLAA